MLTAMATVLEVVSGDDGRDHVMLELPERCWPVWGDDHYVDADPGLLRVGQEVEVILPNPDDGQNVRLL
jgi:hypothetical protein